MDSTTELLVEALAPYRVVLGSAGLRGERKLTLESVDGEALMERVICAAELEDRWLLTAVVDGIRRDLRHIESRMPLWLPTTVPTAAPRAAAF